MVDRCPLVGLNSPVGWFSFAANRDGRFIAELFSPARTTTEHPFGMAVGSPFGMKNGRIREALDRFGKMLAGDAVQIASVSAQIPCKQGISQEFCVFAALRLCFASRSPCANSLAIQTGNCFLGSGEFCTRNREIEQKSRRFLAGGPHRY